jgi:single-strand DNA-binding protein
MNQVVLVGRCGRDAELRHTPSGAAVMTINLATSQPRGKGEDRKVDVEWHKVVVWGDWVVNVAPRIKKGTELFVLGKISTRQWEDKQGIKKWSTEILASTVRITQDKDASGDQKTGSPDPFNEGGWNV